MKISNLIILKKEKKLVKLIFCWKNMKNLELCVLHFPPQLSLPRKLKIKN